MLLYKGKSDKKKTPSLQKPTTGQSSFMVSMNYLGHNPQNQTVK